MMSEKGWKAVIDLNLNGTFLMSQAVYNKVFSKQNHGMDVSLATYSSPQV
jgi:NAD(P)-dependent dehydrogenase (short-subunit alcohol dehydrogenase family)